jgi:hypothetical protein
MSTVTVALPGTHELFFQMQAADKKRPKEERDMLHRLRPFARLMTAEDYEVFCRDMLCKGSRCFYSLLSHAS